jgi:hypothetical protein
MRNKGHARELANILAGNLLGASPRGNNGQYLHRAPSWLFAADTEQNVSVTGMLKNLHVLVIHFSKKLFDLGKGIMIVLMVRLVFKREADTHAILA